MQEKNSGLPVELGIEELPDKQQEQLRTIGGQVLRVTEGLEAIGKIKRVISRDRNELWKYRNGEPIRPESGMFFAVHVKERDAIKVSRARMVDNGCRSGISFDDVEPNRAAEKVPEVFLATSYIPYAYEFHGEVAEGYQFNGPGAGNEFNLVVNSDKRTGAPMGVELRQMSHLKAIELVKSGTVAIPNLDETEIDDYLKHLQYEADYSNPRLFRD